MSKLFIISSPIGNLSDITYRAIDTLKAVDIVAAEDSRKSRVLLSHYGIDKKIISYHSYNEIASSKGIIKLLDDGLDVALLTDAGTPAVSDPGSRLVEEVIGSEHHIIPIPGPCAASTLISVAGNIGKSWTFEGFLPKSSGKLKRRLEELLSCSNAFVIYESPFRILKLLKVLEELSPDRRVTIGREMTKMYEEFIRGTVSEVIVKLEDKQSIKGEFSLVVHGINNDKTREAEDAED